MHSDTWRNSSGTAAQSPYLTFDVLECLKLGAIWMDMYRISYKSVTSYVWYIYLFIRCWYRDILQFSTFLSLVVFIFWFTEPWVSVYLNSYRAINMEKYSMYVWSLLKKLVLVSYALKPNHGVILHRRSRYKRSRDSTRSVDFWNVFILFLHLECILVHFSLRWP